MNVGLYSFKTIELIQTSSLIKLINNMFNADNIFLYSENTAKEKMSQRFGFNKLLEDYKLKEIDIIVFEDMKSLGNDSYVKSRIYKTLLSLDCEFYFLKEHLGFSKDYNKKIFNTIINYEEIVKAKMDERSRVGQLYKSKMK